MTVSRTEDNYPRPKTIADAKAIIAEQTEEVVADNFLQEPLLSVCLITHNHRGYIRQAIESALSQETRFPWEIIIGDDHSDDGTTEIVLEYQQAHPDKIRVLRAGENLGRYTGNGRLNFIRTLDACRGKYVALLEGDDFWTSSSKLQLQVNALETHPDWATCFHSTRYFWEDDSQEPLDFPIQFDRAVSTVEHLIEANFIQTCSVVFRNGLFGEFPDWFLEAGLGDWPLQILNSLHGNIGFLPQSMAAYRIHSRGYWTSKSESDCEEITTRLYLLLHQYLEPPLSELIAARIVARSTELHEQLACSSVQCRHSVDMLNNHIRKLRDQYERSPSYRLGRTLMIPILAMRKLTRLGRVLFNMPGKNPA